MRAASWRFWIVCLAATIWGALTPARAETDFVPTMPADPDQLDFYLWTVGRGAQAHAIYGHTSLRVIDKSQGLDMNFNWGMFDFSDPSFVWKFYTGDLLYWVDVSNIGATLAHYRQYERRSVVQDKLNLTAAQKATLMKRIIWNMQPENKHYKYSSLFDNCTTRPRDYIDEALGGKLKEAATRHLSPVTFRHHVQAGSILAWWAYLGLDQMTNEVHDQPIRPWEEMFLPAKLREVLGNLPAYDDAGRPVPGQMLLSDPTVLVDLPEPKVPVNPYYWLLTILGLPMAAGIFALGRSTDERRQARILGAMCLGYGLWCCFWGTAYVFNWLTAGYAEGTHNAGLLLMSPLDWLLVVCGARMLRRGQFPLRFIWLKRLALLHIAGFCVLLLTQVTGLIKQDATGLLATTGLIGLFFFGAVLRYGGSREPA